MPGQSLKFCGANKNYFLSFLIACAPLSFDRINVLCFVLNGVRLEIGQVVAFGSRREMLALLAVHYAGNNYRGLNRL